MAHDHNPAIPVMADKIACREIVSKVIGPQYLTDALFITNDKRNVPKFRGDYVIKPNNASGRHCFVFNGREPLDLQDRVNGWMCSEYDNKQWAYGQIKPGIIVERMEKYKGGMPHLMRMFVFFGKCELIWRDIHGKPGDYNLSKKRDLSFWFKDGTPAPVRMGKKRIGDMKPAPEQLRQCIDLAEKLAGDIDHVRVDLMLTDNGIKFSEFTFYPVGGSIEVEPQYIDQMLVDAWRGQ
jgi:hypothetical protein